MSGTRHREPEYERLVEQGFALVCMHDLDGVLTWVNSGIANLLDHQRSEMVGRSLADFLVDPDHLVPYLEGVRADGEGSGWIDAKTRHGETRYLQFHNRLVRDSDGREYVLGHAQDVTPLIESEREVRQRKEELDRVLAQSPTVLFTVEPDSDHRASFVSANVEGLTGYASDDLRKPGFWIGKVHPEDRELVRQGLRRTLELGAGSHEYRYRHRDGTIRWMRSRHRVIRDDSGTPVEISGHMVDVTDARRERAVVDRFFDLSLDLLCIRGTDGYFKRMNPAFSTLLGHPQEELLARPIRDFMHPDDAEVTESALRNAAEDGGALTFEDRWRCADGSYRLLSWQAIPYSEEGLVYAIARDVTDARGREAALREAIMRADEANRAKGEFLANMSHEIRTPMNGIIGMTELALETSLTDQQREYMQMVQNSAEALLETINSILDFSKIEAGKMELEAIDFTLWETATGALKPLALSARAKNVELLYDEGPGVPERLRGDPGRLRQALINLVGNAVKFTHTGSVKLTVTREPGADDEVRLNFSVRDTGIGIAADKLQHIMQPFSQADGSMTRRFGGTGLGLAITKGLIEMMDGQLVVESEEGVGSTFSFVSRFGRAESESRPSRPTGSLEGLRALAVDDNEANLRILREFAERMGMETRAATSAAEALRLLDEAHAAGDTLHLALLDCHMPGMGGFELAERIRSDERYSDLVMVAFTAAGQPGDGARCEELGIASYLLKPLAPAELRDALLLTLAKHRSDTPRTPLVTRHSLREARLSLRVLLAEDNPVNQRLALHMLSRFGHHAQLATSGRQALELWENDDFDVILMDVQMPEMDGIEVTLAIRALEEQSGAERTPIIAMTAHAMVGDRERFIEAGMDDYISKPISKDRLREVLRGIGRSGSHPTPGPRAEETTPGPSSDATAEVAIEAAFDRDVLLERTESDPSLVASLIEVFEEDRVPLFGALDEAVDAEDPGAIARAAHTIKGALGVFSAETARSRAEGIERIARDGTVDGIGAEVSALKREVDALTLELNAFLSELRGG